MTTKPGRSAVTAHCTSAVCPARIEHRHILRTFHINRLSPGSVRAASSQAAGVEGSIPGDDTTAPCLGGAMA